MTSRLGLKRKIGKIWPARPHGRKVILLYHSVGNSQWAMPKKIFFDQINWLTDYCRVLSLTKLIQSEQCDDIQVSLTFDDGYASLYNQVSSIFEEKKINGTVYINTGWMGENDRKQSLAELGHYPAESFLTWDEVSALHNAGWEIGSHGVNHYDFTSLQNDVVMHELSQSKQDIERKINTDCLHFSYPWGKHSPQIKKIVKETGYHFAVGAQHTQINSSSDIWALPRINISKDYSFEDFKNIIIGKWDYLGLLHKMKGL